MSSGPATELLNRLRSGTDTGGYTVPPDPRLPPGLQPFNHMTNDPFQPGGSAIGTGAPPPLTLPDKSIPIPLGRSMPIIQSGTRDPQELFDPNDFTGRVVLPMGGLLGRYL